jgi:predicted nucleic acid-binding protein
MKTYVLDSFALIAYMRHEPSRPTVRQIVYEGIHRQAIVAMSVVNLGEAFFMLHKKNSASKAVVV